MSLAKFIKHIGVDKYNPTEQQIIEMLPLALQSFKPKRAQWTADVVANILILRYGLNGNDDHTLQQLGDIYGRSKEQIRNVEARAFRFIRNHLYHADNVY